MKESFKNPFKIGSQSFFIVNQYFYWLVFKNALKVKFKGFNGYRDC